jgi:hypothetical protein
VVMLTLSSSSPPRSPSLPPPPPINQGKELKGGGDGVLDLADARRGRNKARVSAGDD